MYMFTRSTRLAPGRAREAMSWAVAVTEQVNQGTELDVSLWTSIFSRRSGQLVWSTTVEDLTILEASDFKLGTDDRFAAEIDRGVEFLAREGVEDQVRQLVHGAPEPDARPQYASVVVATLAPGSFARGLAVGAEIADRATTLSGLRTTFAVDVTGAYGGVLWMSGAESLAALQEGEQAVNASSDLIAYLDAEAATAYLPGTARQSMFRRVA